jgi:O-antigen/teichoic acid export membrane protein
MLLTGIAFIIVVHTDLFMLGFLTDTASVGIYKVVVGLSTFVAFLLSVLSAFLTPQLTEKIWLKDNFASQKIVNLANLSSSLAAILIAILLIVFRIPILNLF